MSQNFQLQLIRKTLDELGHGPVAYLLAKRMAAQRWPPPAASPPQSLSTSVEDSVSAGDYSAVLAALDGLDEFVFGAESSSELTLLQRNVATYLVLRTMFLERVVEHALTAAPLEAVIMTYLQNDVAEAFNRIENTDESVPILAKLSREQEAAVLLPLAMQGPSPADFELAIFAPRVLLTDVGLSVPPPGLDIHAYLSRLRTALSQLLRTILESGGSAAAVAGRGAWNYTDIPPNCLSDLIRSATLYNLLRSLYYLPPRHDVYVDDNLPASLVLPTRINDACKDDLPIHLLHTLSDHTEEVWFTRFSPLGRYLATGSLDGTCVIYDVLNSFRVVAELDTNAEDQERVFVDRTHKPALDKKKAIIYFCWEPHERYIVTCSLDTVIRVWRVENITQSKRITRSMDDVKPVSLVCCFTLGERMRTWPCEFLPYDRNVTPHFVVGSPDKVLKVFSVEGDEVLDFYSDADEWLTLLDENVVPPGTSALPNVVSTLGRASFDSAAGPALPPPEGASSGPSSSASQFNRINDFAITPNGKVLITANNDKQVFFYRIPDLFDPAATTSRIALLSLNGRLTSCSISANGKYMLLSIAPEELQVWDISPLEDFAKPFLKQKFFGQSQAIYMVRSCFGYLNTNNNKEELVLSGSDDGYIYMWKLETGQLITRVRGHQGLCNSVDWNRFYKPTKQGKDFGTYWSSVGDDKLVKIWGPSS